MAPLRRDLTKLFTKYPVDLSRRMNFEKQIQQSFNESFLQPIPKQVEERAIYEQKIIKSIQFQLKTNQLLLRRTADNQNVYYLGQMEEFQQKSNTFMENSNSTYELIGLLDQTNDEHFYLNKILKSIDSDLENFYQRKLITKDQQIKFIGIGKNLIYKLPFLYFLPDVTDNSTMIVQPRLSCFQSAPIYLIGKYLEEILQPLFENYSQTTTFLNANDFIQKLDSYCTQQSLLKSTTTFATFKILNLSTDLSHQTILRTLNKFLLYRSVTGRFAKLSSETIEELIGLVLRNLFFIYNNKIYRYIKGLPFNFSFAQLLTNIYLHDWHMNLVREFRLRDLFYGRYENRGFFTWNESSDILSDLFEKVQQTLDTNIKLITRSGSSVYFLEILIENRYGYLHTSITHDRQQQRQLFLLPYTKDHPRLFYRQWFRFNLIRAGLYCSSFQDFEDERRYIEATFLANGYSLDFVEYHLRDFFNKFYPIQQLQEQFILNTITYKTLRRELFRFVEQQQRELKHELQLEKNQQLIRLHYLYDWGSRYQFNKKFFELWSTLIIQDPKFKNYALTIKLLTKHCYLSNTYLVRSIK